MRLAFLAAQGLRRNPLRSALTILGVAAALLAFVTIRTVVWAWTAGAQDTANDRVVTRHKVTFVMTLPKRYVDEVRAMKQVRCATFMNWFGGKDPNHENDFFATIACDAPTLLQVYDDMRVPPDQAKAWAEERQGALVGEALMKRMGWKLGQTITLQSQIFRGDWELKIVGVYEALRKSVDPAQVFFHWELLNERLPERLQNQVGWICSRVAPGASAVETSVAIDRAFDANDVQTLSQDERSFMQSFLGMFSAVLTALDIVSFVILGIMMLILGNTVAMGVRERTGEYAVLRAIGFLPRHLVTLVVGEAAVLGLAGGAAGLGIAYPFLDFGLGRFVEENFGQFFPFFRLTAATAVLAIALAIALGVVASAIPAVRAYRLQVVDALRRVA
jgi:putative ABC transport system permease protein